MFKPPAASEPATSLTSPSTLSRIVDSPHQAASPSKAAAVSAKTHQPQTLITMPHHLPNHLQKPTCTTPTQNTRQRTHDSTSFPSSSTTGAVFDPPQRLKVTDRPQTPHHTTTLISQPPNRPYCVSPSIKNSTTSTVVSLTRPDPHPRPLHKPQFNDPYSTHPLYMSNFHPLVNFSVIPSQTQPLHHHIPNISRMHRMNITPHYTEPRGNLHYPQTGSSTSQNQAAGPTSGLARGVKAQM